ncbi:HNH endonuclease [Ensifer adhaerens]|nr:HNH endonuclease [Ensifer adhaerens]UAY04905.1 HNH endonuclease [Ensifer adhaerens]UAY10337.1 HNH endonuclease [Ensifer adhaerens]
MRNSRKIKKIRIKAAQGQQWHCYYCREPMWDGDPLTFSEHFSLSPKEALRYRCTAEHLYERGRGGADSELNIVAACHYCNRTRHRAKQPKDPTSYGKYVQSRMKAGRWHPARLHCQSDPQVSWRSPSDP